MIVADQDLTLNIMTTMSVNGTFVMGTGSCPLQSRITVNIPGGNARHGIDIWPGGAYEVHAVMKVGSRRQQGPQGLLSSAPAALRCSARSEVLLGRDQRADASTVLS